MIVVKLSGGLGNQMFQYATGLSLSLKNKTQLLLDLSYLLDKSLRENITHREYALNCFKIKARFLNKVDDLTIIKQKNLLFNPVILNSSNNTYLDGYWQCEKYFINIRSRLLKEFKLKMKPDYNNKELLKIINHCNSVAIHIRRGDYVANPHTNQVHGLCSMDYYKKAIDYINKNVKNPIYYVFSDDPEWCRINLIFRNQYEVVDINTSNQASEDLKLMSSCKHFIIANSSFSWWGAWLSKNKNKIVIAPKRWFNKEEANINDIVPEKWIRI